MRKSSAIRAAMRLRKWCKGRQCKYCPFFDSAEYTCIIGQERTPSKWPVMSFEDLMEREDKDATD